MTERTQTIDLLEWKDDFARSMVGASPPLLEQIRIALNRIAKDGNLTKVGASVYALPDAVPAPEPRADEAPQEPPAEATDAAPSPFRRSVLGTGVTSTSRGTI